VVCVFARKTSEPLTSLVKQIDKKIDENAKLKSFVVLLSGEDKAADELRKLAKDAGIKHIPLTLHQDPAGLPSHDISKDADITVLMWKGQSVVVNRAYKGTLTDKEIQAILDDVPKVLK
jgi:hypothetical protein